MPTLLQPGWLLLLLALPILILGAILAHRRRNIAWKKMIAPRLRKQLVKESSQTRSWISLALALLGCTLIIIAIARPYQGKTSTTEKIRTRNIIIAIDTSRSMLVQDGSPDRITTAKAMALELLQTLPHDRIGIIAFSGTPVLMAPLTIDHQAIHETISQLDTEVIPSGGSDLAAATTLAIKTLTKASQKSNALIIISDGEDHSPQADLTARNIRNSGITVCTIGTGTNTGGIIPDPNSNDGKYHDVRGRTVNSRMIPDALDQLARAGRGIYLPAAAGTDTAIRSTLSSLESNQQKGHTISIPNERYQWFLLPAIIFLTLSLLVRSQLFSNKITAPSTTAVTSLILLAICSSLQANNKIEQAETAYKNKDYRTALELFTKALPNTRGEDRHAIQFSQGSTAYHLKQWDHATRYFSHALLTENRNLQAQTHYNLANTLFQSGWSNLNPPKEKSTNPFLQLMRRIFSKQTKNQSLTASDIDQIITNWQDSISHYQATLNISPDHQNATHNLKEVEKLLKQLNDAKDQAEQESQQSDKEQGDGKSDDPNDKDENNQQGDGNDPQEESNKNGEGKPEDHSENNDPNNPDKENDSQDKSQPKESEMITERKEGESEEAFAARILKDHSDAETRPVTRRLLQPRRPAKDW